MPDATARELLSELLASADGRVPAPLVRRLLAWLRLAAPVLLAGRMPDDLRAPSVPPAPRVEAPRRYARRTL